MARNKDMADLTRRFAAIPKVIRRKVQPAVDQGGAEMVARIRYLAPSDDGDLQTSIEATQGPVELSVTVSAGGSRTTGADGFDHAVGQEYGTKDMPRNSFFWPSVNSLKKRVRSRIDRAISKAIKEGWK